MNPPTSTRGRVVCLLTCVLASQLVAQEQAAIEVIDVPEVDVGLTFLEQRRSA